MLAQDLLVVMRTVLAAAFAMENAAFGRRSESDGHFQGLVRTAVQKLATEVA